MAEDKSLFQRSANVYRLHELVDSIIGGVSRGAPFVFDGALLKRLHRVVAEGQLENNGDFRQHGVCINGSPHQPPNWIEVDAHVLSMCRYIAENWERFDMVQLAAFVLWRLNWIHPFTDGNGRTSRAAAYLVMGAKHGKHLPGKNTVLIQIMNARHQYCEALRKCDDIYLRTQDTEKAIKPMADMLSAMLIKQLTDVV